jgi:putative transcriptional regulator
MKNTIRVERTILHISRAELAERVQMARQTINAIELGKYAPSAVLAIKIARVFGKKWRIFLNWRKAIRYRPFEWAHNIRGYIMSQSQSKATKDYFVFLAQTFHIIKIWKV